KQALWGRVQMEILEGEAYSPEKRAALKTNFSKKKIFDIHVPQTFRVAAILSIAIGLSWIVNLSNLREEVTVHPEPVAYVEYQLPAGVKSSWTLADGSKVVLNAGSRLRHIK